MRGLRAIPMIAVMVVLASGAAGCEPSADPITLVDSLRVLAVRAEPPEVGPDGRSVLTPLTVDPKGGGRPLSHAWRVCDPRVPVYDPSIDCAGDMALPLPAATSGDGSGAELSIADLLSQLAGGASLDQLQNELSAITGSGARAAVTVSVIYTVSATPTDKERQVGKDTVQVVTLKRVTLSQSTQPNQNPVITGLRFDGADWQDGMTVDFEKGKDVDLGAWLDPASFEIYPALTPDGKTQMKSEDLSLSWFITDGSVEGRTRDYIDVNAPPPADQPYKSQTTKFTMPDTRPSAESTFWLVLIDGRGGTSWQSAHLNWR
jgi:hypothetical protein